MAQNPLLGNRISLISKKDIRYEGILYSINEADSTLALQNVRAFGTEGREKVDSSNYIGPQDAVHPYLLFRGCDIKDLHVHESEAKLEKTRAPEAAHHTAHTNATVSDKSNTQPQVDSSATHGKDDTKVAQKTKPVIVEQGNIGSNKSKQSRKSIPVHQVGTGASLLSRKARGSVTVVPATPSEEFDIQSKLAEFTKDVPSKDQSDDTGDILEPSKSYEKDDFFDSISCDSLDNQHGIDNRLRGAKERNLNTETFGAVALNSQRRRRRGGGRGGRGRGRGGRGRGRGRNGNRWGLSNSSDSRPQAATS
ncbi:unnamed protein product [Cylindrotheca closterium]|uniref:DFDF domain-containing protein n=1 Tax=Cylindrotheca closterium TaxID=2856 RepID=A0AAD2FHG6_9STRA|nr:unnamed protein product [Cylindrotheca closterium]